MALASTPVDSAVIGVRDHLAALADALARGGAPALDESGSDLADHLATLQQAMQQTVTGGHGVSPGLADAVDDARWQIERCRRLGAWLGTWPPGSSPVASAVPTYLPTGQGTVMAAGHTSIEVTG